MFDQPRSQSHNVVQLGADGNAGLPPPVVLTRLPVIIHGLRDKARQQLQGLIRELFEKVDDTMFELADKATNNHEQNIFFDSMREVRVARKTVEILFFRNIDIGFAQLLDHNAYRNEAGSAAANNPDKEFSLDDLSLVKNDDLEGIVAVEAMIHKANEQFAEQIQHLTLRIDHLVPVKVYQKNNPLGADIICHAFNDAASAFHIDVKAKLVLFKLFDNLVMANLGSLLQTLNGMLIDANILPSLTLTSRHKRPPVAAATEYYGAGLSADYSEPSLAGIGQLSGASASGYDESTNQVLRALRDLLGSRGAGGGSLQHHRGGELASQDLVKILSLAQQQNGVAQGLAYGNYAPVNVRELLQQLLLQTTPGQPPQAINQVDEDVINLVSMMFDFILDDRNLAAPMKALIGRLQIPMVKVAIADKSFFSKGGHPARRLLNEMAMAALGWQESGEDNQRKDGLYSKMEAVVQTILSDFEADVGIFSQLLRDFREFLEKDERRAKILEQRTLDAEAGMAKSDRARAQVDTVLARITAGREMPAAAQKLLLDAWGNVLFITLLKFGADSDYWQDAIRAAQQLVWSLTAPMNPENRQALLKLLPELLPKLRRGLDDISYSAYEAAQLFKQLEILHLMRLKAGQPSPETAAEATAPVASDSPPREQENMAAAAVQEEVPSATAAAAGESSLASLETIFLDGSMVGSADGEQTLPEGDPHLVLVANITQGSWFEMQGDAGQKFRCRLAAIIRSSGKYIFVNRSGMKVAEESRMSLALALKSGRLRLLDDGMLFDRALEAVISNLRAKR